MAKIIQTLIGRERHLASTNLKPCLSSQRRNDREFYLSLYHLSDRNNSRDQTAMYQWYNDDLVQNGCRKLQDSRLQTFFRVCLSIQKTNKNKRWKNRTVKPDLSAMILIQFHFIHFSWNYLLRFCSISLKIIFSYSISPKNPRSFRSVQYSGTLSIPVRTAVYLTQKKLHTSVSGHLLYLSSSLTSLSSFF